MNSRRQERPSDNTGTLPPGPGMPHRPVTKEYSLLAIGVGLVLLFLAFLVVMTGVEFPYKRLLVYAGVAALFAGIGANAAVRFDLGKAGQAGAAGGAAAIAIALGLLIPSDEPGIPKISMTYYVNFPDKVMRNPDDLTASVSVTSADEGVARDLGKIPISWSPGGNGIKLTIVNLPIRDFITLKIHSARENKTWTSASVMLTESFMNLNEGG
jgi:hypothetical protein